MDMDLAGCGRSYVLAQSFCLQNKNHCVLEMLFYPTLCLWSHCGERVQISKGKRSMDSNGYGRKYSHMIRFDMFNDKRSYWNDDHINQESRTVQYIHIAHTENHVTVIYLLFKLP